jgi:hypothetical protein
MFATRLSPGTNVEAIAERAKLVLSHTGTIALERRGGMIWSLSSSKGIPRSPEISSSILSALVV